MKTKKTIIQIAKIIKFDPQDLLSKLQSINKNIQSIDDEITNEDYKSLLLQLKKNKQPTKQATTVQRTPIKTTKFVSKKIDYKSVPTENKEVKEDLLDEKEIQEDEKKIQEKIQKKVKQDDVSVTLKSNTKRKKTLLINELMTPKDLSHQMGIKVNDLIKQFVNMGMMITVNQNIDQDTCILVAEELGFKCKSVNSEDESQEHIAHSLDDLKYENRNVVVTIMGHVDHGKTTLLDYIRNSRVQAKEAGGITQHIGAYQVTTSSGKITFLDTPGHEAFTSMRARGTNITDLVILIVAADDGVMPQTIEAIKHAKAAEVPIIVAINKFDKPGVDIEKIKTQLSTNELTPEEWGGDTMVIPVSAKTGDGIPELLEAISLNAEVLELKAPINGPIKASVIESRLDKGKGPVVTVLVETGTIAIADIVLCDIAFGKIRTMINDQGQNVKHAVPGMPVEITGFSSVPSAGSQVVVVNNEKQARELAAHRITRQRQAILAEKQKSLNEIFTDLKTDQDKRILKVIVKADVHGSTEAIVQSLNKVGNETAGIQVISDGVGSITENDVQLAGASEAIIIGFNVRPDAQARKVLQNLKVNIYYFNIIYDLIEKITAALEGLLAPQIEEKIIGYAEVKDVFHSSKLGAIAGCIVVEGQLKKAAPIRVLRKDIVIFEGKLESLRHYQQDVQIVKNGSECGVGVKSYNDIVKGDRIEAYELIETKVILS